MDAVMAIEDGPAGPCAGGIVEAAYVAYGTELQRRLVGLVRDPAAAEDLAQEAFLRLHVEVQAGRAPANVRAWLHRVAGNLVVSRGRRARVASQHAPRLIRWEEATSTEDLALRHDGNERLVVALTDLRPHERQVLVLAASGLSGPEIAGRIGRSHVATRTLLSRARLRLRERVEALESTA